MRRKDRGKVTRRGKSPNDSDSELEIFKIPIEVPYRNATRDVVGITSVTSFERAMRLIAERMDAGPSRMAAIGYIPSYKPKNPKPVAKLLEDDEAWDRLIDDVKTYIDSFASKRGAARQVKPFVISIIDTLELVDPKESKVSVASYLNYRQIYGNHVIYPEFIILEKEEDRS